MLLGAFTGLFFVVLIDRAGPVAALLPLAALVVAFLLSQPRLTLAALLGVVIVIEADPVGLLPIGPSFYSPIRVGQTPPDLLFYILLAGTALQLMRERSHPRGIGPMTLPLIALTAAAIGGLATGVLRGCFGERARDDRDPLRGNCCWLPLIVANLLTDKASVRAFLVGAAGLAAFKAITGLAAGGPRARGSRWTAASSRTTSRRANWLMLMFLLFCLAARVRRFRLPGWGLVDRASGPPCVPAVLPPLVLARGRVRGDRGPGDGEPSLGPNRARDRRRGGSCSCWRARRRSAGSECRARCSSARNRFGPVRSGRTRATATGSTSSATSSPSWRTRRSPGSAWDVPWSARHPLSEEGPRPRNYVHVILLWYWLKLGLLGVLAFVWLYGMAMWTAVGIWRRHPDEFVRIGALAALGGLVALAIVELTASFTGVEPRLTIVFAALIGWIAAAWRQLPRGPTARATASTE